MLVSQFVQDIFCIRTTRCIAEDALLADPYDLSAFLASVQGMVLSNGYLAELDQATTVNKCHSSAECCKEISLDHF